ncbi:LysM peptidoglycan-binding domain-containing protein [Clostridium neuense]|uniref:LysM peptidoglycan-binding domain-containing protein n=1 Tax=Clostridium neuense TaxID=1728934 RepID=A0ABW8TD03_9CLOT
MNKLKFLAIGAFIAIAGANSNNVHAATYSVKSGDSLYTISRSYSTNTNYLMEYNNLAGSTIYPGQTIKVPDTVYTVKSGDSLYLISQKFGVTLGNLRWANNIWSDYIYPGQTLAIPAKNSSSQSQVIASPYVISCTNAEVDLLARLINAEAGGESYTAMKSVGAVIVNRVKSGTFPNTITKVIYDTDSGYYQFTPVENGMINNAATASSLSAAKEALRGADPTNGALYFYDNTATNSWLRAKPVSLISGKLIFAF